MNAITLEETGLGAEKMKVVQDYLDYHAKGRQEAYLYQFEELIIVSMFSWWTRIEGGGYCSPRTVTDDACRRVNIFKIENMKNVGHRFDSNLFRTTKKGVVGRKYDVNISSVTKRNDSLLITFVDGDLIEIQPKEN